VNRADLGQEQLVIQTHGAQLRFGIGMAPSTNLLATHWIERNH
jgi:hypothetical protein